MTSLAMVDHIRECPEAREEDGVQTCDCYCGLAGDTGLCPTGEAHDCSGIDCPHYTGACAEDPGNMCFDATAAENAAAAAADDAAFAADMADWEALPAKERDTLLVKGMDLAAQREEAVAAAVELGKPNNLPALTGTPAQIQGAVKIRGRFNDTFPKIVSESLDVDGPDGPGRLIACWSEYLAQATAAKDWIDYRDVTRPEMLVLYTAPKIIIRHYPELTSKS